MNIKTLVSSSGLNSFQDIVISQVISQKENLMREVLQRYLGRDVTNEDWLKFRVKYSINSEEIFYNEVFLGTTEIHFENDKEDFKRNNFRVVCNFKPCNPITSTFPIIRTEN